MSGTHAICGLGNQAKLLITAEFLDGGFALQGAAASVAVFAVNHFQWFTAIEIFRSAGVVQVFLKAPFQFGGDAGVQRVVVAADDVDRPVFF